MSVRYRSCEPCSGQLVVTVRGRTSIVPIRLARGTGVARSLELPQGRWPFSVVLRDPKTGIEDTVRRRVSVSR